MASNFKLQCLVLRLHLSTQFEHSALIRQITHSHIVFFYTVLTLTLWWMHQGVEYLTQWYFDTWTGGVEDWTLTSWLVNKLFCYLNYPWIEAQQCYIHFNHSGQLYTESAAWQGLKNSTGAYPSIRISIPFTFCRKYMDVKEEFQSGEVYILLLHWKKVTTETWSSLCVHKHHSTSTSSHVKECVLYFNRYCKSALNLL